MAEDASSLTRRTFIGGAAVLGAGWLAGCRGGGGADTIKIGYVTARTGALASFGEADRFVLDSLRAALKDGVQIQGKSYHIDLVDRDCESNSTKAAAVAQELIVRDGVAVVCVASTHETTVPVVQTCIDNEVPVVSTMAPWQQHYAGIGGKLGIADAPIASEWNYHFSWGLEDVIQVCTEMWQGMRPGAIVGAMWPDDRDGMTWSDATVGFPPELTKAGFKLVDPGRFALGGGDYTAQIERFKNEGVEVVSGVLPSSDFGTFWTRSNELRFLPMAVTVSNAFVFPSVVASYENSLGFSSEIWWSDRHPTTSSLTGESATELARGYENATQRQWTQTIGGVHALFEVAVDALIRAGGAKDKRRYLQALGATKLDTIAGTVDFTTPVVPNIAKTPLIGGQWATSSTVGVELRIANNSQLPGVRLDSNLLSMR
jgi:branched-chain amino acid transport system substrate-binding protein